MMEPLMLTVDLRDGSILLNSTIVEALEHPRQVQILINEGAKKLVLRACSAEDIQAVVLPAESAQRFEIAGRSLLKRIRKLTGWQDNSRLVIYGEFLPAHQAVRFNLMDAETVRDSQDTKRWQK